MRIVVNGEERSVPDGTTIAALLGELGLESGAVVVERNREIVARDDVEAVRLEEGDRLEIVRFVGGG